MADIKEIKGLNIPARASDPANPVVGEIWYNTTSNVTKGQGVTLTGSWASGGTLGTSRDGHGAGGTQTAGIVFGGNIAPGNTANTEEYDGSTWTEVNNLNTARRQTTGVGIQTAALCAGGYGATANSAATEEYDGTSWTSSGNLATNRRNGGHFGIQTSSLYCGGYDVPDPNANVLQEYNGSTWTNLVATLNTGGNGMGATGTTSDGIVFGGANRLNNSEEWNGTSMSVGGTMLTSKYNRASTNQAPANTALSIGGGIPAQTNVEAYDGTCWSAETAIPTATQDAKGGGDATSGFIAGGGPGAGPIFNTSFEWTGAGSPTTVTISSS